MDIYVTRQDIKASEADHQDPIEHALKRMTGCTWLIFEPDYIRETESPYRSAFLPAVIQSLREWIPTNHSCPAFEFSLTLESNSFDLHQAFTNRPHRSAPRTFAATTYATAR